MIQLLFLVLVAEAAVAAALLFKTPLRKLAVMGIDRLKRGRRAPVAVKTVAGVVLALLASTLYSMAEISGRAGGDPESGGGGGGGGGSLSPTDQVLFSRHLLEASLMGYSLFLALVIDRLHRYIRELRGLKKNVEAVTKHNKMLEEAKHGRSEETKKYQEEIAALNEDMKKLKLQVQEKTEEVHVAEDKALAIRKQSESLLLEYDRLLEDNQHLREQLQSIDLRLSSSK
uniref:Endoplasmic reticulum transmembrane protein n=1 Tax=Oryza punctata TaxID=4537 RepID=A0A0E0JZ67_ORYPU